MIKRFLLRHVYLLGLTFACNHFSDLFLYNILLLIYIIITIELTIAYVANEEIKSVIRHIENQLDYKEKDNK